MSRFYITTPIYYVNDVPHLGHAYTTMVADALARFHAAVGDETWFLTGTDEHGQKIEEAAQKRGITPRALTDEVSPRFAAVWRELGIANNDFIRTTEARHQATVRALWQRMADAGDLYLAAYEGWYCVGCEAFYTESQLVKEGDAWHCATHKRAVDWVAKERSWFFRLSKYQQPLLDYIAAHPNFIRPEGYRNEVVAFLQSGLRDLSVSRTSFSWGITPPAQDPEGLKHVIYVWLDALANYYSALCEDGKLDSPRAQAMWPGAVHLIGKDILRFHAVYWPAFLLSAGLPLPQSIVCHGWWTVRGEKISKSLPATRIDPVVLAHSIASASNVTHGNGIGVDAVRYFLLREVPLGNDGDFSLESLFARYNAELANDLGNLVNRSLTLVHKFSAAYAPTVAGTAHHEGLAGHIVALRQLTDEVCRDARQQFTDFAPARALETIWKLVREGNRFVDGTAPWVLAKRAKAGEAEAATDLQLALGYLRGVLHVIADLVAPVLPTAARVLHGWLGVTRAPQWPDGAAALAEPPAGPMVASQAPLFPKLDDAAMATIAKAVLPSEALAPPAVSVGTAAVTTSPEAAKTPAAASVAPLTAPPAPMPLVTYDDFAKLQLLAGKVLTAQAVPKAKKLLQLQVDVGEATPRTIVAGIALAYAPEALVGKQVLVVANLQPATIRGVESHGMILAAGDDAIVGLAGVDQAVAPGTRVR